MAYVLLVFLSICIMVHDTLIVTIFSGKNRTSTVLQHKTIDVYKRNRFTRKKVNSGDKKEGLEDTNAIQTAKTIGDDEIFLAREVGFRDRKHAWKGEIIPMGSY